MMADGIAAMGHLWKLSHVVDTASFQEKLPWIAKANGRLKLMQRKRLLQLVLHLYDLDYGPLASRIDKHLVADAHTGKDYPSFTKTHLHHMAIELAAAIQARRKLRLGSIWNPTGCPAPYRAVFVWADEGGDGAYPPPPAFVFTSAWQGEPGSQAHDANDIDRHVSLRVDLEDPLGGGVPHLRVSSWLPGMCFFDGCPLTKVVFPWPRALQEIKP